MQYEGNPEDTTNADIAEHAGQKRILQSKVPPPSANQYLTCLLKAVSLIRSVSVWNWCPKTIKALIIDIASFSQVSSYQRSLGDCLRSLGLAFQQEADVSGLLVDALVPSKNLVIELDGPSHFARNSPQLLGPAAFKHRMLKAMGMKVLSITLDDWDDLRDMKAQRRFLETALKRRL